MSRNTVIVNHKICSRTHAHDNYIIWAHSSKISNRISFPTCREQRWWQLLPLVTCKSPCLTGTASRPEDHLYAVINLCSGIARCGWKEKREREREKKKNSPPVPLFFFLFLNVLWCSFSFFHAHFHGYKINIKFIESPTLFQISNCSVCFSESLHSPSLAMVGPQLCWYITSTCRDTFYRTNYADNSTLHLRQ